MGDCGPTRLRWGPAVRVLVLSAAWALGGGQVRYSVPEEAKGGTVVGRLAQDLGLEAGEAEARRLRLVAQGRRASVEVSGASGALVVSSRLDREELCGKSAPCALRLEVLVERPLRVFHVELEVTDINDNAPLFPVNEEALSIAELTTLPGTRFPLEGASDADVGANAQLSYTLSPSEHFSLDLQKTEEDGDSLLLVLRKPLDRETLPVHRLVVTASDGGRPSLTGTMELVISVLDANDNAPQFNQSMYKVKVLEGSELGTLLITLSATDVDEGINGDITYSFSRRVAGQVKEMFTIDENKGEIRLQGKLDYEEINSYEIAIEARDKGSPPLSGHCKVVVEVLDVNDNAPEVRGDVAVGAVPEDAAVGTVVALLSVSDRDSGANGRVRCAVWPAAPFGLVATFAGSYSLVLREALDRERVSEYEVEVRAEDGGAPPLRASRGLRVPVSDVNDNAPAFAQAVYTVLARENNGGAELARLWARDPDEAGNGRVSYSVAEGTGGAAWAGGGWRPASSYVAVDAESGRLWALQPLDYEELQVLQFEVRAVDAGEPPLCGNATVQLFVVDENDNAPALLPAGGGGPGPGAAGEAAVGTVGALWAWAAWGAPAGQVVAKIRAVDADSGYNAWLRYELWEPRGKSPFRVGLYSGEVSTARALEEADGPRQRLVIVVRDHGEPARSATATLSVSLVEGGEAALAGAGAGSSSSSGAGTGLRAAEGGGTSALSSAALSANVWLVVAICAVSSLFVLAVVLYGAWRWAPRAGALSGPGPATLVCASEVGSWSYSQRQSRSLCVAEGAGKSDLMVFSPNFPLPPPPGATVKEAQPEPPALLDTVSGLPLLASRSPTFPFPSSSFLLPPSDRRPFLTPPFPPGPWAGAGEAVLAGGGGGRAGPGRVAAAMGVWWGPAVRVLVLSAAWALGGGQVRYSVPEEAKGGTVVGRLAQDLGLEAGEAEARRLRLVAQGRRASVEVSGASALVVSSRLDREELCGKSAPCALPEVLVERPLRVFHVELEVTDINDNAPLFPAAQKNLSLSENSPPGSRFPLEGASDADIGSNAQLSYTLSPSELGLDVQRSEEYRESLFLVLKPLDRETLPVHRLVTASDGGRPSLTGTMELLISVLDANDNAPQFNQSVYKVQLPESAAEGYLAVNATDLDVGSNGEITFSASNTFPSEGLNLFVLNPKTGEIRLTGALDFEEVRSYEIEVEATDKGTPPLSGHCKVGVEVLDVNDNVPEVRVTSLSVPVPEDAAVGTVVALLSVSDRDSGANGRVRCAVWPAAPFGLAATFAGSYSLVLREALDRERVSEYEVEVRAEDGGAPPLRASSGLRVPVSDVNDNAPAFAQAVYTAARENNAAGAELARLWARDPDEAGNGRVSYSVAEGAGGAAWAGGGWRPASSYVAVDAESGRLWALQPLDYEELQVLQFEVRAVDAGEPPLCGNATVQLFVVDENDNAPALLPAGGGGPGPGAAGEAASGPSGALWAWAAWGAPAGQVVAKIRAVDADSGYNAWLRYELWEPRGKSPFRVGLYSGEVSTARALEEADGPRQRLVIVVRDHGEPARSATATLSVSLVEGGEAALAGAGAGSSSSSGAGTGLRAAEGGGASALSSAALSANVWLVVAICAVSSLFVLAVVLYGAWRWAPRAAALSGPGPATLVCASEVGSWSYSQRQSRSLCVAEGVGKSDLMVFSPNFPLPPPPVASAKETQPEPPALLETVICVSGITAK
ncbi:LOW QUALITY PROTEIN: uncharacterized protein FYW35_006731 [Pterocles gutturalis]